MIILYILLIIILVSNFEICVDGALYGLSLWYTNVVPLLLPFMLISSLISEYITKSKRNISVPACALFLGLFCGYPVGAIFIADMHKKNILTKNKADILLPLCSFCSPMFLFGYIFNELNKVHVSNNSINAFLTDNGHMTIIYILLIYSPAFLLAMVTALYNSLHNSKKNNKIINKNNFKSLNTSQSKPNTTTEKAVGTNHIERCLNQICSVGVIIMLCSIVSEFILKSNPIDLFSQFFTNPLKEKISCFIELTRGVKQISVSDYYSPTEKTALILACTSFGGVSTLLQVKKVLADSKLSFIYYTISKIVCSVLTYYVALRLF